MQFEQRVRWIPGAGVSYHVGVDGLSLPLLALTCLLFLAGAVYSLRETRRIREFVACSSSCRPPVSDCSSPST